MQTYNNEPTMAQFVIDLLVIWLVICGAAVLAALFLPVNLLGRIIGR